MTKTLYVRMYSYMYIYVYLPIRGSKRACMYIIRTISIPLSFWKTYTIQYDFVQYFMGFLFTHLAHMKSYDIWKFFICFVVCVVIWRFMLIKIWHPQLWWCSIQMMQLRFAILTNHVFRWLLVVPHLSITKVRKKCYIQLMVCTMEISKFSWTFIV